MGMMNDLAKVVNRAMRGFLSFTLSWWAVMPLERFCRADESCARVGGGLFVDMMVV